MTDAAHVVLWILTIVTFAMTWTAFIEPNWRVRARQQFDPTNNGNGF